MMNKILVALSTFSEYGREPYQLLENSGYDIELNRLGRRLTKDEVIQLGKDSLGIIAGVEPYDLTVLENLPNLKCISRCGAGIDNINIQIAEKMGITIRNTPDVVTGPVAELTIAMIFDLLKKLTFHTHLMRNRTWKKVAGNMLEGKQVGIIGLGKIGRRVAEHLIHLGAKICGFDPVPDYPWAQKFGVNLCSIDQLITKADILSLHLSANSETPFTLDRPLIKKMKPGSLLVNVSRGHFVDEQAVTEALQCGQLGGAAFDVFPKEPYTGMLCDLENVILTPHLATLTRESRLEMEILATKNLLESLSP